MHAGEVTPCSLYAQTFFSSSSMATNDSCLAYTFPGSLRWSFKQGVNIHIFIRESR